jgi:hypothetical protein
MEAAHRPDPGRGGLGGTHSRESVSRGGRLPGAYVENPGDGTVYACCSPISTSGDGVSGGRAGDSRHRPCRRSAMQNPDNDMTANGSGCPPAESARRRDGERCARVARDDRVRAAQ